MDQHQRLTASAAKRHILRLATDGLVCDRDARTLSGLLLPFGEQGRTNLGLVTASAGTLALAERVVGNLEHDSGRPVAVMVASEETDDGLHATFRVSRTTAGDDLLTEAEDGLRTGLSVEVEDPIIRAGALRGGTITGAAFTTDPAFPSARLAASDVGEDPEPEAEEDPEPEGTEDPEDADTDLEADALDITRDTTVGDLIDALAADPAAEPAPTPTEGQASMRRKPNGLAAAAAGHKGKTIKTVREFVSELTAAVRTGDTQLLAALQDITQTGVGGDVSQAQFLGELWSGRRYQRRFVPLMAHADLTSYKVEGWRWVTKPEVSDYSGDKSAVPSNVVDTEPAEATAARLAGAHDLDRKFVDFGDEAFLTSYLEAMRESYAVKSDLKAEAFMAANATAVVPGTVPTGANSAAVGIVDAALSMVDVGAPSFAILGAGAWRQLLLTQRDDVLEFLSMSLGLEEGSLDGFRLVPGSSDFAPDDILVGIQGASTFYELPGSPIRVDALDIVKGGADIGLFGYYATMLNDERGLALAQSAIGGGSINAGADYAMTVGDPDGTNHAGDPYPVVLATYPDGSVIDVTENAVLTSGTPSKATIVNNKVRAVAAGTSVITATYQGKTDTTTVTVS